MGTNTVLSCSQLITFLQGSSTFSLSTAAAAAAASSLLSAKKRSRFRYPLTLPWTPRRRHPRNRRSRNRSISRAFYFACHPRVVPRDNNELKRHPCRNINSVNTCVNTKARELIAKIIEHHSCTSIIRVLAFVLAYRVVSHRPPASNRSRIQSQPGIVSVCGNT